MPSLVNKKEIAELLPRIASIVCPSCGAAVGERCVYRNNARRAGDYHHARFIALKRLGKPSVSRYGNRVGGGVTEDSRPLASRRLTLREMRDCGAWVPLKEEK